MSEFTIIEGGTIYEDNGYSYIIGFYFDEKKKESFYVLYNRSTKRMIPGKRMKNSYSPGELKSINNFVREATENVLHNFRSIHNWNEENLQSG